jgi:hypothetical protein
MSRYTLCVTIGSSLNVSSCSFGKERENGRDSEEEGSDGD